MGEVLGARNPTTIREHLEAIASYWESCPAVVMEHAGVALYLMRMANRRYDPHNPTAGDYLLVYDPDPGVGAEHA